MDYLQFSERVNFVEKCLNIEEIVSRYVNLKKADKYYRCRCPFHDDNGESLIINPESKMFYCPVCHVGGNALKFLAVEEKSNLLDIIDRQAKILKLELYQKKNSLDDARYEANKRELAEIYEYTQDFYHEILIDSAEGAVCRKYLESRGISNFAIEKFNLGFVSKSDKRLTRFLYEYNFNVVMILESGLISHTDKIFDDIFQNCIIFPVSDPISNASILIGRIFDCEKKDVYESQGITSKYIYPDENSTFNKQKLIFGLNAAKKSCEQKDTVILVEDCLDAVILSSAGIENVVAVPEKNLDSEIAGYLTNYARRIIFCLKDGDTLHLDEEILKAVATCAGTMFVAALPENPAQYLDEHGKTEFIKYIEKPLRLDEYKFFKRVFCDKTAHPGVQTLMVPENYTKIPAEIQRDKFRGVAFLKLACTDMGFLEYVSQIIPPEIFDYEPHQEIFRYLKICLDEDSEPDKEDAIEYFDRESFKEFLKIMRDPEIVEELKKNEPEATNYLVTDKIRISIAAEDAIEQLLRKMVETRYVNIRHGDIASYTDFIEKAGTLQDIHRLREN